MNNRINWWDKLTTEEKKQAIKLGQRVTNPKQEPDTLTDREIDLLKVELICQWFASSPQIF